MVTLRSLIVTAAALVAPALAAPIADTSLTRRSGDIIPGGYIVTLKSDNQDIEAHVSWVKSIHKRNLAKRGLSKRDFLGVETTWASDNHWNGYAGLFDDATIEEIRNSPDVEAVEENRYWYIDEKFEDEDPTERAPATQEAVTHGLGSISHRQPGATKYLYDDAAGEGTFAYVVDSGIRDTHEDFEGRAKSIWTAYEGEMADTLGHGSHVAGTIGGAKYGVAKKTQLLGVKVFRGETATTASIVQGISFAIDDIIKKNRAAKSVINLSLGGRKSDATNKMIDDASAKGIISVVAAGNDASNADDYSPASAKTAITVGSADKDWKILDTSNWGKSLDLFAPGGAVTSVGIKDDKATATLSGTSMAAPHVAGLVLTAISVDGLEGTDAITKHILKNATPNSVKGNIKGSPNLHAHNGNTRK